MTIQTKLLMFGLVKTTLSQYYDSLETDLNLDTTSFNKSQVWFSYHPSIGEHNFGGDEVFGEEQHEFYLHANETESMPSLRAGIEFFKSGHGLAIAIPEMLRLHICWHFVHKNTENINKRHMNRCHWKLHHIQMALRNYGCNCFPSNFDFDKRSVCDKWNCMQWTMGKNGKPIDKLDKECAHLRDRIKCLELDAEKEVIMHPAGPDAILVEERCSRWTTFPYFFANGELYCGTRHNPNYVNGIKENEECEFAICQITRLFVLKSWKEMIVGQGRSSVSDFVKDSKLLYNINRDPDYCDRGIASRSELDISSTECCGEHPFRRSYRPIIKDCCADGSVANFGECPF